jgi:hypothetical protein
MSVNAQPFRTLRPPALALLGATLFLAGCSDGNTSLDPASDAVLTGRVDGAPGEVGSGAQGSSAPGSDAPAAAFTADVRTVTAGYVRGNGTFEVAAEAELEADGSYRIEGVPSGRSDLVVQARSASGAALGSALVWAETRSGAETRVPPINARSTTEARVEARLRASGSLDPATRAELALLLALDAGADASATSEAELEALAQAFAEARSAFGAHLAAAGGTGPTPAMRASAAADALADFGVALASGASVRAAHRTYAEGLAEAWGDSEARLEALVLATAAASQRMSAAFSASGTVAGTTSVAAARSAVHANLAFRSALATAQPGGALGLRAAVLAHLSAIRSRVDAAGSLAELRAGLAAERAELEGTVATAVIASLGGLEVDVLGVIDARVRTAAAQAAFWTRLEGATSVEATVSAVAAYRADLEAAVAAWIEALPAETAAAVDAAVAFRLFLALGGGASIASGS